jgi:hypothetical protein
MEILTKKEAILNNSKFYFTGILCKNNHLDKRYTNTGICYQCKRDINKRNRINNIISCKQRSKRNYEKHKNDESYKIRAKKWILNNKEKVKIIKQKNKQKYKTKYLEKEKIRNKVKRKYNPFYKLSKNMSKAIWDWLKGNKNYRHWETLVGYTMNDLKSHLEKQFYDDMTWENYGQYWHIDHIIPLSWFKDELDFNEAWKLSNLQPLKKFENLSKNNRYIGKYRPT